ncbi:unnamed protein product [Victoria cruziana]
MENSARGGTHDINCEDIQFWGPVIPSRAWKKYYQSSGRSKYMPAMGNCAHRSEATPTFLLRSLSKARAGEEELICCRSSSNGDRVLVTLRWEVHDGEAGHVHCYLKEPGVGSSCARLFHHGPSHLNYRPLRSSKVCSSQPHTFFRSLEQLVADLLRLSMLILRRRPLSDSYIRPWPGTEGRSEM